MIVLDTHALVWWVTAAKPLSARARRAIGGAARDGSAFASAISMFEIATAARRGRLAFNIPANQWLTALSKLPELRFQPMTVDIARIAGEFDETLPSDPADRIIVATALVLNAQLVSADRRLKDAGLLEVIW